MPDEEGLALYRAGIEAGRRGLGPLLEIGTYCGKSAVYLGGAARECGTVLFSVDHHRGSLELQPGWPDHDPEVVDRATGLTDTLPWARRTLVDAGLEDDVVLVVGESSTVARWWQAPLSLLFIDGGHGGRGWPGPTSPPGCPRWPPAASLAVHDVFADPSAGGQVPFSIYLEVLRGGDFVAAGTAGSLRASPAAPRDSATT